jgi:hypothetical protein
MKGRASKRPDDETVSLGSLLGAHTGEQPAQVWINSSHTDVINHNHPSQTSPAWASTPKQ